MPERDECPIDRNLPQQGLPLRRWLLGVVYVVVFSLAATGSLLWALGYRVNAAAGSVEQTGVLELSSAQVGINPSILINGIVEQDSLPFKRRWLFPGRYDILVKRDGYQSWEKTVDIHANERISFSGILLLYETPHVVTPTARLDELLSQKPSNDGIEVRGGNELWVRDIFITRTSADILNPQWYGDDNHIIYQSGTELVLRDLTSRTSQRVATLIANTPVPYMLQGNGRIVTYAEGETLHALELYQSTSFFDRLTPG